DRLHITYDRELAGDLAVAEDWDRLRDRWAERRGTFVQASPAFLGRVLHTEKPEYLDVVALVTAHRAHFQEQAQIEFAARARDQFGPPGRVIGWGGKAIGPGGDQGP